MPSTWRGTTSLGPSKRAPGSSLGLRLGFFNEMGVFGLFADDVLKDVEVFLCCVFCCFKWFSDMFSVFQCFFVEYISISCCFFIFPKVFLDSLKGSFRLCILYRVHTLALFQGFFGAFYPFGFTNNSFSPCMMPP